MMLNIPQEISLKFNAMLRRNQVPQNRHNLFKKWLRYYLDFCHKYKHHPQNIDSLPLFINKLREKKQAKQKQKQAFDSVLIYYEIFNIHPDWPSDKKKIMPLKKNLFHIIKLNPLILIPGVLFINNSVMK